MAPVSFPSLLLVLLAPLELFPASLASLFRLSLTRNASGLLALFIPRCLPLIFLAAPCLLSPAFFPSLLLGFFPPLRLLPGPFAPLWLGTFTILSGMSLISASTRTILPLTALLTSCALLGMFFLRVLFGFQLLPDSFFLFQTFQLFQFFPGQIHFFLFAVPPPKLQLLHRIFLDFLLVPHAHDYLYQLAKYVDTMYLASETVQCSDRISDVWKSFIQFLISFFLIFQAAHQPAAHT